MTTFILVAARAAAILAVVLVALRLLANAGAATRRSILVAGFAIVLALPIASIVLPAIHVRGAATTHQIAPTVVDPIDTLQPLAPLAPLDHATITSPSPASPSQISPLAIGIAIYAFGVLAVLARFGLAYVRARRMVRSAKFVETFAFNGRPIEVRISRAIESPAVTGLFVPVVLLPEDAATWTAERRRIVLAHELAHVTSHDCLTGALAQLAVAIHWFDPLAWIAARRLRIERELAADDRVLDGGVKASSYAEHLLALATSTKQAPAAVLAMAEPAQVAVRIRALLATQTRATRARLVTVLAAATVLTAFVACTTPEREAAPLPEQSGEPTATFKLDPQGIVNDEAGKLPANAVILVLDPKGNVVAHAGEPTSPIVIGSTLKPLVISAALDQNLITATDTFDTSPQPNAKIVDSEPHGMLGVGEILAVSSNVGISKIVAKLSQRDLDACLQRYHLPTATPEQASLGEVSSTPSAITAAYATLANDGVDRDGTRIVRAETAATMRQLLEGVIDHGTGKAAHVDGVRVAGKTGTARLTDKSNYASFVGIAPADHPKYIVFVGAETSGTGGQVAAPVAGRVMTRLLSH
ncbi:MAG: M56 family metallopeptidase [Kofleriaceae bacterium]